MKVTLVFEEDRRKENMQELNEEKRNGRTSKGMDKSEHEGWNRLIRRR